MTRPQQVPTSSSPGRDLARDDHSDDHGDRVITFGCRLNAAESDTIASHLNSFADRRDTPPVIVINTCAVTSQAERQARQAIRRAHREHPDARIVVTGCSAQIHPESYRELPGVWSILANTDKTDPASWARLLGPKTFLNHKTSAKPRPHPSPSSRTRVYVEVQNGCDHHCTFCIIPQGRGKNRSRPIATVIEDIHALADQGVAEVVLTGVDLTSYGQDLPGTPRLGQLVAHCLREVPHLPRLRLSSLDPAAIDEHLWQALAREPRLMPHWHLSMQAGEDLTLKRMRRRHRQADLIALVARARALRPNMMFGADLIAGFPTETAEMFAQTAQLVASLNLVFLHVFPYSPRPGTPAARMPQVPPPVVKQRAQVLRSIGNNALITHLTRKCGTREHVLMETPTTARANDFTRLTIADGHRFTPGTFQPVVYTQVMGDTLVAVPA